MPFQNTITDTPASYDAKLTTAQKFSQLSPAAALAYLLALEFLDGNGTMPLMTPAAMAEMIAPGHQVVAGNMSWIMAEWLVVRLATLSHDNGVDVLSFEVLGWGGEL